MSSSETISAGADREVWHLIVQAYDRSVHGSRGGACSCAEITAREIQQVGISANFVSWLLRLGFLECARGWTPATHRPGQAQHLLSESAAYVPTRAGYALSLRLVQSQYDWPAIIRIIANRKDPSIAEAL